MLCASQGARVVFAKAYRADVMITAIFFSGRVFVTLSEAGKAEQDLVDTLFPQVCVLLNWSVHYVLTLVNADLWTPTRNEFAIV